MRLMTWLSILCVTLLLAAEPALGASPKGKTKKSSRKKPAAVQPTPAVPVDHAAGAVSSCKKHVENMLKSPATQFPNESSISAVKADEENFDVAGAVRSANAAGQPTGGNFHCHAQLIGGAVWSTKTSLDFAR